MATETAVQEPHYVRTTISIPCSPYTLAAREGILSGLVQNGPATESRPVYGGRDYATTIPLRGNHESDRSDQQGG